MVRRRYVLILATLTLVLFVALVVSLRSDRTSPSSTADPEWLFALTTSSGSIRGVDGAFTLSFDDSDGARAIAFTDRPDRLVSHISFGELLSDWDRWFAADPPNAALVAEDDQGRVTSMVLELTEPSVSDGVLTFRAVDIGPESVDFYSHDEATAPTSAIDLEFAKASLFIDQIVCTGWLPGSGHCFDDGTDPPPPTEPSGRYCWGGWLGDAFCNDGTGTRDGTKLGTTTDSG